MPARSVVHALLLAVGATTSGAGQSTAGGGDTVVTVRGFCQRVEGGQAEAGWKLVLVYPLRIGTFRVRALRIVGDPEQWTRYQDRFVEATGLVTVPPGAAAPVPATIALARIKEVTPAGAVRRTISPSFSQRATVTLAVIPNRFAWRDETGQPSGVAPSVLYTVGSHGDAPLDFEFSTNEVLCVSVQSVWQSDRHWEQAWQETSVVRHLTIKMGNVVRYIVPLPEDAARDPGRYVVRASLCGVADYESEAEFDVTERRGGRP